MSFFATGIFFDTHINFNAHQCIIKIIKEDFDLNYK